jgi:hypothetical protein
VARHPKSDKAIAHMRGQFSLTATARSAEACLKPVAQERLSVLETSDPMAEVPPAVMADRTMSATALPIRMNAHNRKPGSMGVS